MNILATFTCAIVLLVATCVAQEQKPANDAQVRKWIDQLANTRAPRHYESPADRLSKEERQALEPVKQAYEKLTAHFLESLPLLIDHLDDQRFSYPSEHPTSGVFTNQNVGHACHNIIQRKVLLIGISAVDSRGIGVGVELPLDKDWYKQVSGMTLYEMQLDALDRLLKSPKLERITAEQWEDGLLKARKFRDEFVRRGQAIDRTFGPSIEGK